MTLEYAGGIRNARIRVERWDIEPPIHMGQDLRCGPTWTFMRPAAPWMVNPITARNECTGEPIRWDAEAAPTQRMEVTPIKNWSEMSAEEIITEIRAWSRRAREMTIELTPWQAHIMAAYARGERVTVAGGRRAGMNTLRDVAQHIADDSRGDSRK